MLEFFNLKPEAFGLNISDLSLKIIKLKKKRDRFTLASFGEEKIKPGIIKEGEIKDEESLTKVIKESMGKVKGEKIKTKYVIASLPEEKAFLQIIRMPIMSEEDLKSAVIFEAENYIPLPIEEIYLDFQIVKSAHNNSDHLDVLIIALPKKIVDDYLFCLKKAGFTPQALEVESLAIVRAVIKEELNQPPVLLIDLGVTKTNFIIFSDHSVCFTSSVNIPSQITPTFSSLTDQIEEYIDYYKTHSLHKNLSSQNKKLEKILLCGERAAEPGLTDFLSSKLALPIEKANPFINILSKPEGGRGVGFSPEEALNYTTALGLALRGIKEL